MLKIKKEEKSYLVKCAKELNKGHISFMNIQEVFTVPILICLSFFFFFLKQDRETTIAKNDVT